MSASPASLDFFRGSVLSESASGCLWGRGRLQSKSHGSFRGWGQAGSADDGGRAGVVETEAEERLNCTAWGEIPQTEEALHMDMNMRRI